MYFNFEEDRPDTPTMARAISAREGVLLSIILHLLAVITILVLPSLPFMREAEARRQQAIEEQRRLELERMRQNQNRRFVFVQPRLEQPAPPRPRADLSDLDRQARTVERAPKPTNPLPFSRGNSPERIDAPAPPEPVRPQPEPASPPAAPSPPAEDPMRQGLTLPNAQNGAEVKSSEIERQPSQKPAVGVIADAIRNVQKYVQREGFVNLEGGANQEFAPFIQFDTKGVEFGPWLRRFVAQIRSNWFIPYAAMSMRGHVVVTFNVHKDGRITDVAVLKPSRIDAFTKSAQNAILASNPTVPLPPEYPEERAFFTVTFYFNETPDR
jgi:TonB family protein